MCRCEGVSLGGNPGGCLVNPRPLDMDGIKRRTRAMMGRCQGGFCTPNILTTLAKELGIAPEEVTKAGGASGCWKKEEAMEKHDVVVIGAGPAGLSAAAAAYDAGAKVLLLDRESAPGGFSASASTRASACTLWGRS